MRKLTATFIAVEALWIGMWIGVWETYPVKPWPDEWRRPVVITSAAVLALTIVCSYRLLAGSEGEQPEAADGHDTTQKRLKAAREIFLQLFALFLAVEATFKILEYLHWETASNATLTYVRNAIEVGSVVGTFGLIFHFFRSLWEARYVIVALTALTFAYFVLQAALVTGANVGEIKLKTIQQGLDSGFCHFQIDLTHEKPGYVQCLLPLDLNVDYK